MFGRAFQLKTAVNDFLKKHELNADHFDHEELVNGFIREMEKGLKNTSSLQMEPSYIVSGDIRKGVPVCVADLGGTFLRTAKAVVDDDGAGEAAFTQLADIGRQTIIRLQGGNQDDRRCGSVFHIWPSFQGISVVFERYRYYTNLYYTTK